MERTVHRIGLVNLLVLLVVAVVGFWLANYVRTPTGLVADCFFAFGFLIALVSYFQMRLAWREQQERLEVDELTKSPESSALFSQEAEAYPARRAREQFERIFVPGFTLLLLVLHGLGVWWLWQASAAGFAPRTDQAPLAMALYGLFGLIFLLLGKYASGYAQLESDRLLRPGASYLLFGSVLCFTVTIVEGFIWFGFSPIDFYVARVLTLLVGLVALEYLIALILEIYRPRLKGQQARMLYESRLIGLFGQPGGLVTTAAQALDYQFGFKVSETWFYRFLERALGWIVLCQIAVLFLSTMIVVIEPQERAVLERFGRPVTDRAVLAPGAHFKWPWPIDKVYRQETRTVHTFYVGAAEGEEEEHGHAHEEAPEIENTLLWTRPHMEEEFNLLVASRERFPATTEQTEEQVVPVNLLTVSIPVQYRITNLVDWSYNHQDPASLLKKVATREVVRYLVSVDFESILSSGRLEAAENLRNLIQEKALEYDTGAEIVFVGLQDIHPPVKVADAYEAVNQAIQQKETNILAALAYKEQIIPSAKAEAVRMVRNAKGNRIRKTAVAEAQAGQFTNQIAAYQASPDVYTSRTYLEAVAKSLQPARKLIMTVTNASEVIQFNLEDQVREDVFRVMSGSE